MYRRYHSPRPARSQPARPMERKLAPPAPPARRRGLVATRKWLVLPAAGEPREAVLGRHRIMKMTGLPTRDLRVLDPDLDSPSTILVRERAVVVNLEHVKVIIMATDALVLHSNNPLLGLFLKDLHARFASPDVSSTSSAANGSNETDQGEGNGPAANGSNETDQGEGNGPAANGSNETDQGEGNGPTVALCRSGSAKILPFELKVLEVCLEHTYKCLESETLALEKEAYPALNQLISNVSRLKLEHVRHIKNRLVALSGHVQKVRDELERLLDDDMDMSEMYLTRKLAFQGFTETLSRMDSNKDASTDHDEKEEGRDDETETDRESSAYVKPDTEELEMLVEAYFMQIDGALNKLYNLREYVDNTEDYINIMLDEKQNQLLQMGVLLTSATVVVTAGIVVVSLFGMNIHIELMKDPETNEQARIKNIEFWLTTCGTVAGCLAIYLLAIYGGKRSNILH